MLCVNELLGFNVEGDGAARPLLAGSSTISNITPGASSFTYSHTVPAGATLLVVRMASKQGVNVAAVSGVTFGGVALTKMVEINGGSDTPTVGIWYLLSPSPSTANIVITWTGTVNGCSSISSNFSGATAVGASDTETALATSTGSGLTITTTFALPYIVGVASIHAGGDITWPSPYTEEVEHDNGEFVSSFGYDNTQTVIGTVTPNLTLSNANRHVSALMEIVA